SPNIGELTSDQRAQLADYWLVAARMEHAAVGAFARFVLQLLAFGAPADLVEASQRAMVDETRHAKICFALTSVYAGCDVSPDKLSLNNAFDESSPREVLEAVIREGCIGECLAAL
ncbi:MAG: hypothetical protein NUV51_11910, partial [Sulfuricaulis sp.]|nr:hypothetical protein [Sulfuricaulis sp.]